MGPPSPGLDWIAPCPCLHPNGRIDDLQHEMMLCLILGKIWDY